jgi:hypothetical protein
MYILINKDDKEIVGTYNDPFFYDQNKYELHKVELSEYNGSKWYFKDGKIIKDII